MSPAHREPNCISDYAISSAYATDIVAVQRVYYNQIYSFGYQWMIVMSTQLIGFSFGGAMRRFLVAPPSMIWPANLVLCALFNTLHSQSYAGIGNRGGISRERFFIYAFTCSVCWCRSILTDKYVCFTPTRSSRLVLIRLLPRVSVRSPLVLQLGMLDRSEQHPDQPDVRLHERHGHVVDHVRLGPDRIYWVSPGCPVVGCC